MFFRVLSSICWSPSLVLGQPKRFKRPSLENGEVSVKAEITKKGLTGEEGFDQLLSDHYALLKKLEATTSRRLMDVAEVESACATSDTYVLGEHSY